MAQYEPRSRWHHHPRPLPGGRERRAAGGCGRRSRCLHVEFPGTDGIGHDGIGHDRDRDGIDRDGIDRDRDRDDRNGIDRSGGEQRRRCRAERVLG